MIDAKTFFLARRLCDAIEEKSSSNPDLHPVFDNIFEEANALNVRLDAYAMTGAVRPVEGYSLELLEEAGMASPSRSLPSERHPVEARVVADA